MDACRCRWLATAATAAALSTAPSPADGAQPDLVVERWTTPATVRAGAEMIVSLQIANAGPAASGIFTNELRLEAASARGYPARSHRWPASPLAAGQSLRTERPLKVPAGTAPGEYVLRVVIDVDDDVAEENEHNNVAERRVMVTAPGNSDRPAGESPGPR